ncbi:MAG: Bax inhibitor-1 family protein [Nitriliruptoraceae bacterium]
MSYSHQVPTAPVAQHSGDVRTQFMRRVYIHLLAAIGAFIAGQYVLFTTGWAETIALFVRDTSWLLILGGFMIVSWMASSLAVRMTTPAGQYGAFGLLIAANVLLFATPLYIAAVTPELEGAITQAAQLSVFAFAGLSIIAIRTSRDFSFLRSLLMWGGVLALGLIIAATLFGTGLGTWFSVAMIGFAGAAILYDTQKIYHEYPPHAVVPAAMNLFASIALLFWYILRLVMGRR